MKNVTTLKTIRSLNINLSVKINNSKNLLLPCKIPERGAI